MAKKNAYYVVWKGRRTGIFSTWAECSAQVGGFPGAVYKGFSTLAAARSAFEGASDKPRGRSSPGKTARSSISAAGPVMDSYAVDASCIGPPGPVEYRCVHTDTGRELFRQGPFANGTNNIGESLAIVHALARLKADSNLQPVYTDSQIALGWVKRKTCRTKQPRDASNAELFDLVDRAEAWLRHNQYENAILKWQTELWGENPADFGRKTGP